MMIGNHLIADVSNIKDPEKLYFMENVKEMFETVINDCRLNVVNEAGYQFKPFGCTYVYVLSESHLSIHTYPELNKCFIDLFCCSDTFDVEVAIKSIEKLFPNAELEFNYLPRGS